MNPEELLRELEEAREKIKKYERLFTRLQEKRRQAWRDAKLYEDGCRQNKLVMYLMNKAFVHRRFCEHCRPGDECDEFLQLLERYKKARRQEIRWDDEEFIHKPYIR